MFEGIVVGIIQGIAEWIPISSEGMIVLAEINLFGKTGIEEIIKFALFLHLGTFLAALVYLRKEVWALCKTLIQYKKSGAEEKNIFRFLLVSTFISGGLGFGLLKIIGEFEKQIEFSGHVFTGIVGMLLLGTAYLQLKKKEKSNRKEGEVTLKDSVILGIAQGIAVLPGLSRSGLTVSALLLRKVEDDAALRLSFLMSLPIVLLGNIVLNFEALKNPEAISAVALWGLAASFFFGLATIHILMKIAKKINFGHFVGFFGILMLIAAII